MASELSLVIFDHLANLILRSAIPSKSTINLQSSFGVRFCFFVCVCPFFRLFPFDTIKATENRLRKICTFNECEKKKGNMVTTAMLKINVCLHRRRSSRVRLNRRLLRCIVVSLRIYRFYLPNYPHFQMIRGICFCAKFRVQKSTII